MSFTLPNWSQQSAPSYMDFNPTAAPQTNNWWSANGNQTLNTSFNSALGGTPSIAPVNAMGFGTPEGVSGFDIGKMGMQPQNPANTNFFGDMTGIGKVGFGLSALNTFGQLGLGYRAMRAQEDANAHTKNAFNLNFGMKKEQYDRSIRDRAVAHAGAAGLSGAARDAYIAEQAKKVGG